MSEWEETTLGEIVENLDSIRVPVKESERNKGIYPYYGASGIVDYVEGYLFDGLHLLVAEDGENLRTKKTPIAFLADGKFWVNNHAHIIKANKKADTRFICYALQRTDINSFISGSTIPKLTKSALHSIPIFLPTIKEQKFIAAILGALDDKIELNRRMNATLEAMSRALFKSWFVDFDPVRAKSEGRQPFGMDAETATLFTSRLVPSTVGDIPEGWYMPKFSDLFDVIGGGTPKTSVEEYWNGDIQWFSVVDAPSYNDVFVLKTEKSITQKGVDESSTKILPLGTTIISARGTVGRLALVGRPMAMNQSCYGLSPAKGIGASFLYFSTKKAVAELQSHAHGSVFDTITRDTFDGLTAIKPPADAVSAFEATAWPMLEKIKDNLAENIKLEKTRDYLLPKLISGAIRISDVEKFVEAA